MNMNGFRRRVCDLASLLEHKGSSRHLVCSCGLLLGSDQLAMEGDDGF